THTPTHILPLSHTLSLFFPSPHPFSPISLSLSLSLTHTHTHTHSPFPLLFSPIYPHILLSLSLSHLLTQSHSLSTTFLFFNNSISNGHGSLKCPQRSVF